MDFSSAWKGFKLSWNNIMMQSVMWFWIGLALVAVHLLTFIGGMLLFNDHIKIRQTFQYYYADFWGPEYKASVTVDASGKTVETDGDIAVKVLAPIRNEVASRATWIFIISGVLTYILAGPMLVRQFQKAAEKLLNSKHLRGAKMVTESALAGYLQDRHPCRLKITKHVMLPMDLEVEHVFVIGRSGSGKTVMLTNVLLQLMKMEKFKLIVYCYKGDYISRFFNPTKHILFDPFDHAHCIGWNLFNDIREIYDVQSVATSLIPNVKTGGTEEYFNDAARDLFMGILAYALNDKSRKTNEALWEIINSSEDVLKAALAETDAGRQALRHIMTTGSGQTAGVLSTLNRYVGSFQHLKDLDGPFSFRDWINDPNPSKKVVFLANSPKTEEARRPLLSLVIDRLAAEIISLPNNPSSDHRIFFFLDEFPTLHPLSSLVKFLTLARSKGGSMWLGAQDFGRIKDCYGEHLTETLYNNPGTHLVLKVEDPNTAEYLSRCFGDRETIETVENYSMGVGDQHWRDGLSASQQIKRDSLILASELTSLEALTGYLKVGAAPVAKVTIPLIKEG